jgi:peptidoglycan/xylan/chitin deacetylase (PgdA/CDA1 family)
VALTYDDGPNPTRTSAVLAALDSVDAKATFFVLGTLSKSYPGTLRNAEAAGHAIGNHSYSHQYFIYQTSGAIASSIKVTDAVIRAAGVDALKLVRPPGGNTNPRVKAAIEGAGFTQILWTWGPLDYNAISAWTIASGVISHAKDGAVFVLHDNTSNYRNTAAATKTIVTSLRSKGYCFGASDRYGRIVRERADARKVLRDFDGDGFSDVFWYGPGSSYDVMWFGTSTRGKFTSVAKTVNGVYLIID